MVARSTLGAGIGAVLIALCMIMVWQTFRFNTFAAPQVRIQKDREQRVITDGPYRIVRHPMYAGALLMFVGTPLLLGSWWGLLFVPVGVVGIGIRAVGEERMLRRELRGYDDYARQVRFRMSSRPMVNRKLLGRETVIGRQSLPAQLSVRCTRYTRLSRG